MAGTMVRLILICESINMNYSKLEYKLTVYLDGQSKRGDRIGERPIESM